METHRVMNLRLAIRSVLGLVALIGFMFVAVFPTRTFFQQRSAIAAAEERLVVLRQENRKLEKSAGLLRTDAEIERIARARHNLVKPGEEAYVVLPAPNEGQAGPGGKADESRGNEDPGDKSLPSRVWRGVFSIL